MLAIVAILALAAPHSDATLVSSLTMAQPGKPFLAAIRLTMDPGWHSYWENPGDSGIPTSVEWKLPAGWKASSILWPTPHRLEAGGLVNFGYEKETLLLVRFTPPATSLPGARVNLTGTAKWLICQEGCLPAEEAIATTVAIGPTEQADPAWRDRLEQAEARLPRALPDYSFAAVRGKGNIGLTVTGPSGLAIGVQFFPADEAIEASAPQKSTMTDGKLNLTLKVSQYAPAKLSRLKGLLVAPPGSSWKDGVAALLVDTKIAAIGE